MGKHVSNCNDDRGLALKPLFGKPKFDTWLDWQWAEREKEIDRKNKINSEQWRDNYRYLGVHND